MTVAAIVEPLTVPWTITISPITIAETAEAVPAFVTVIELVVSTV